MGVVSKPVQERPNEDDIKRFLSTDEKVAKSSFDEISVAVRPILRGLLRRRVIAWEEREDLVQEALIKLWHARTTYRYQSMPQWWKYLFIIADRVAIDHARKEHEIASLEATINDIPDDEMSNVVGVVAQAATTEAIDRLADAALLGVPYELSQFERNRRLLAGQFFYLHHASWQQILRVLKSTEARGGMITRPILDHWLDDPATIRLVAYRHLYVSPTGLSQLLRERLPEATEQEREAVEYRYRYSMTTDQIERRCDLEKPQLKALFARCASLLPFGSLMESLLTRMEGKKPLLKHPEVWQRLAFQYNYRDGVAHLDILERINPAAKHVGEEFNPTTLNTWLSGGRLVHKLAQIQRRHKTSSEPD